KIVTMVIKWGLERRKRRQMPGGCRKERRNRGIGRPRLGGDRQAERQFRAARDTDIGANQPRRVGFELLRLPGRELFWRSDRDEKIGRSGVAVIANPVLDEVLGSRPED